LPYQPIPFNSRPFRGGDGPPRYYSSNYNNNNNYRYNNGSSYGGGKKWTTTRPQEQQLDRYGFGPTSAQQQQPSAHWNSQSQPQQKQKVTEFNSKSIIERMTKILEKEFREPEIEETQRRQRQMELERQKAQKEQEEKLKREMEFIAQLPEQKDLLLTELPECFLEQLNNGKITVHEPKILKVSDIADTDLLLFIGERKSGKSTTMLDILLHKNFNRNIAFCLSPAFYSGNFLKVFARSMVFHYFDKFYLQKLFTEQLLIRSKLKEKQDFMKSVIEKEHAERVEQIRQGIIDQVKHEADAKQCSPDEYHSELKRRLDLDLAQNKEARNIMLKKVIDDCIANVEREHIVGIVFDDIGNSEYACKSSILNNLCIAGRHPLFFVMMGVQEAKQVAKKNRRQFNFIFVYPGIDTEEVTKDFGLNRILTDKSILPSLFKYVEKLNARLKFGRYTPVILKSNPSSEPWDSIMLYYTPCNLSIQNKEVSEQHQYRIGSPTFNWVADIMYDEQKKLQDEAEGMVLMEERIRAEKSLKLKNSRASASSSAKPAQGVTRGRKPSTRGKAKVKADSLQPSASESIGNNSDDD